MSVTRTSPTLSQLSGRRITDIEISGPGDDDQWTNGETVDITVRFGGTAKFANPNKAKPSVWTPGWCQNTGSSRPHSTHAAYASGANSASLLFECTIFNGPHTSLRLAPNSVHDASNNLRISGTVSEYSWSYNLHPDLRHGAVVKELPPAVPPALTSATVNSGGTGIELVFSEILDFPSTEAEFVTFRATLKSFFAITAAGMPVTVETLVINANKKGITFHLFATSTIGQGQSVLITYTDPTAGDDAVALQDAAGNETPTFTTGSGGVPAVTNNSTVDKTGPALQSATVNSGGTGIELVFSEILDFPSTEAEFVTFRATLKSFFAITAAGMPVTVETLVITANQKGISFHLFATSTIGQGQSVLITYTDPTAGDDAVAIQDTLGNETRSFTTGSDGVPAVTNNSTATSMQVAAPTITGSPALSESGSDGTWTAGATVEVTLTFSEVVTVDTTGGTPSIGLELGGTESRRAPYLRGSGTTELDFGYTLTTTDASHTSMLVPSDSLALNGGAIRSQATSANAALSHNGAAKSGSTGPRGDPFTARFEGLPQNHNGSDAFTFELHFSEAPETLSYTTVAGGLMNVTGATVTKARRLTAGSNRSWEVTVTPSHGGDIAIRLPARACGEANAVCAGGRALASAISATVEGVPLTASFSGVPAEHDGTAFDIRFHLSEEPAASLSFRTVQNRLFDVTGGSIKKASRLVRGKNKGWSLSIAPAGFGDITVRVIGTTACDTPPGVCTPDGRKLAGGLQTAIAGPAVLSVADAEVDEAEGATLDFVATLSRARNEATTVDYATSDGTATAGSDYTATSGRLIFAAGEISKTVPVTVHDDSHDEGAETMVLTLSNPSGAVIDDGEAIGTINNTDAMPRAWMVRFGRTVGSQVVDALNARLDGADGSHVTLAGINVIGEAGTEPEVEDDDPFGLPKWAKNAEREADAQELTADDLLLRSAFHLSSGAQGEGAGPAFTAWGRVATGAFEAVEDGVTMDGDVTTGLVGFDAEWERALAGIMFSQSSGDGAYRLDPAKGTDAGTVESSLTGVYPYARIDLNAKVSAWALAGAGSGELTLHQTGKKAMPTDISMRMGAVGVKGQVLDGSGPSGVGLNVKSDAMWVGTKSEDTEDLAPTRGAVTRLRLILQGERSFEADNGATFTPSAELGLRHDGGDAETGTGIEVGAGLRYSVGAVTIEAQARTLVAHEDSNYEEWGMSGAIRVTPSPSGRGLTLSIAPAWGQTGSAAERLWSAHDARALGADSEFEADSRIAIDAGFGFGLPRNRGVLTPYAGLTLGDAGNRTVRAGTRWQFGPDVVVGLEATRQTSDAGEPTNEVRLRAALRF